jgi:hypothetical protein
MHAYRTSPGIRERPVPDELREQFLSLRQGAAWDEASALRPRRAHVLFTFLAAQFALAMAALMFPMVAEAPRLAQVFGLALALGFWVWGTQAAWRRWRTPMVLAPARVEEVTLGGVNLLLDDGRKILLADHARRVRWVVGDVGVAVWADDGLYGFVRAA